MARNIAKTPVRVAWATALLSVALGLTLWSARSGAQIPDDQPRPRTLIKQARELYTSRDYEAADRLYQQAMRGQNELSMTERQDLAKLFAQNSAALKARLDGAAQVRQAQDAIRQGKNQDASALLKAANANQFLTPADRQMVVSLSDRLRGMPPAPTAPLVPGTTVSKSGPGLKGDPQITYKENDPKSMLGAARKALELGDVDFAETLVKEAERNSSTFTWMTWGDTPTKVRRDIHVARARQMQNMAQTGDKKESPSMMKSVTNALTPPFMRTKTDDNAVKPPEFPGAAKDSTTVRNNPPMPPLAQDTTTTVRNMPGGLANDLNPNAMPKPAPFDAQRLPPAVARDQARKLIDDGYRALQVNDLQTARRCAEQAKALRPDLNFDERNPDRLLAEIQRRSGTMNSAPAQVVSAPADAKAMVKQARAMLQKDQLDEAEKLTNRAAAISGVHYGLFEDSPERLRADLQEAKTRFNREKSKQLMVEGRKAFNQGNLAEARARALQAKELHGPYSMLDFGERPQKLLDDIARAEAGGNRKGPMLPNDAGTAPNPAIAQNGMPPTGRPQVNLVSATTQAAAKQKAFMLLAEARDLERRGFLIEARQKATDADALGVVFSADEDSPRNVMLSLASKSDQRIQQLLQQAGDIVRNNPSDPTRFDKAAVSISTARQLAQSFGLDTNLISQSEMQLQQAAARAGAVSPIDFRINGGPGSAQTAGVKAPVDPRSRQIGTEKLNAARLEIKAGNYPLARRIAEEAYNPSYGVQQDAAMVLRTIDAEEHLHQASAALKNYDAGMEAFLRRDFRRAAQLWQTVDVTLLPVEKQRRLGELMQDVHGGSIVQANNNTPNGPAGGPPGTAVATDRSLFDKVAAMEEVQAQQLRERSLAVMNNAMKLAQEKKLAQATDSLKSFLQDLDGVSISKERTASIRRQVESKLNQYNTLLARQTLEDQAKVAQGGHNETERNRNIVKLHEQVAKIMQDARDKYKDGDYKQSWVLAKQAKELDNDNSAADALIAMSHTKIQVQLHERNKEENEEAFLRDLDNNQGPHVDMERPLHVDKNAYDRAKNRKSESIWVQTKDPTERMIEKKLETPQSLHWKDTSLEQIIEDLKTLTNINVVADLASLKEANVSMSMPMSLSVENVKLKSALNLLLGQAKLTYMIKDQVLQITTEERAQGKTKMVIHPVADLVVPVENHQTPEIFNLASALMRNQQRTGSLMPGGATPYLGSQSIPMASGLPVGHYGNETLGQQPSQPSSTGFMMNPNNNLLPGQTMERMLIDLIKNAVSKNSWSDAGGKGEIQFYPLGMALVVNQTLEVQEEVAALLNALRRLQDLEIAVEMRMVSVSEAFFEKMGLDFDINIKTPHSRMEQNLLSGQFAPFGSVNRNLGVNNVVSGLTPAGTLTPDLNIPIRNSSYDFSVPPFGGFPGTIGQDGGLSLGLAFLNDIQVFMFLEAAQGDRRTNVMQAPKVTMFNGQVVTLTITDQQFFLTDVQLAVPANGNQLFFVPNNAPYPLGISITVTAVVSADRRFVRINPNITMTNLASATVPLFPVQIVVPQFFDGPGNNSSTFTQPQVFQMFFQQPTFTTISINTTVNVPDGGTVLLGGLKTLSEGRNEYGPPILGKIPYLSRLFRNTAYGRESQSLMIMVTPRIIINEEEEQVLFGQINIPRP